MTSLLLCRMIVKATGARDASKASIRGAAMSFSGCSDRGKPQTAAAAAAAITGWATGGPGQAAPPPQAQLLGVFKLELHHLPHRLCRLLPLPLRHARLWVLSGQNNRTVELFGSQALPNPWL